MGRRSQDRFRRWINRLEAARGVWERRKVVSDQLEDALCGDYPGLIPGTTADKATRNLNLRADDQINVNLLLRAANYMVALAFDEFPTLRFSREPGDDDDAVTATVRLVEKLMDEGGAMRAMRDAMMSSFTRGPCVVCASVEKQVISPSEVVASTISPGSFVEQALAGQPVDVPDGVDFQAVAEAARAVTENPDTSLGLQQPQIDALNALAEDMEVRYAKSLDQPKPVSPRAKIVFDALPYGTRCLWDSSVTDFREAGWIARRIVMNRSEFEREESFKPSVVKGIIDAIDNSDAEADDNQNPATLHTTSDVMPVDERERIVVWEVWDRINQKRHYLCESAEDFLERDDAIPYLDEYGRALLPGFWPIVVCTPYKVPKEDSERSLGLPWLEIGWPLAVEFIKLRSAAVIAAKKSARMGIVQGVSDQAMKDLEEGSDGTFIRLDSAYDRARNGDPYTEIKFGGMPMDYLTASKVVQADFASIMGLSLASLTSESVADTLGQEQIAMQGSNTTQGDMIRQFEAAFADLAMVTLMLFRAYASEEECQAYMGTEAHQPRQNPDGSPRSSVYEAFKTMPLVGSKLTCRFASGTRADDAVYVKQLQDFIALSNTLRDTTNTPYFDVRPLMERLGKAMDIEGLKPYTPTAAELAQIMATQMAAQMQPPPGAGGPPQGGGMMQGGEMMKGGGGKREAPGGGRTDGRRAGGQRGPAPVPGRQGRNREPASEQNMMGQMMRPMSAKA